MNNKIAMNIDFYPFYVQMPIQDFHNLISAALDHDDDLFVELVTQLHEMVELHKNEMGQA